MCKTYSKEWIFLKEKKKLNIKGTVLDRYQLEQYLEKIASDHILTEKSGKDTYPIPRLKENFFVIKEIYKAGMFVTSGNSGKYMSVHEIFMGKPRHVAQLGNFMRDKAGRNVYKDGNPRNCTKRNVSSKTQLKLF